MERKRIILAAAAGFLCGAAAVAGLGFSQRARVIEAEEFVLKDSRGRARLQIVCDSAGALIRTFDSTGAQRGAYR